MMGGRHNSADWATRLQPVIAASGYELVQAECQGDLLRVLIDRPAGEAELGIGLEDCERISRELSAAFADLGDWTLEVSSPGLDRPLLRPADFVRFAGSRVRLRSRLPVAGSRQFTGRLCGADANGVKVAVEGGAEVALAWDNVAQARLAPLWPASARPGRRQPS